MDALFFFDEVHMIYDLDTAGMRYRLDEARSRTTDGIATWLETDHNQDGQETRRESVAWDEVVELRRTEMWDVKTPNFKKLQKEGRIVNSPMLKRERIVKQPLYEHTEQLTNKYDNAILHGSGTIAATVPAEFRLTTPERVYDAAVTSAFARMSANESNLLLWAGEFRETIAMFYGIGRRLLKLAQQTKEQRIAYAKGKLSIPEAQSMTLGILYGLLPLEEAFKQWQEGLTKILPKGRQTFRGFQSYNNNTSYDYRIPWERGKYTHVEVIETLSVNVRAGVLVDIDPPSATFLTILEPRSVVSTAWALSRLSFVIDWFVTIGPWLASWSPTVGTKVLSSWIVIETKREIKATHTMSGDAPSWAKNPHYSGSGVGTLTDIEKRRIPVDPTERPYLPSLNINLNLDKLFALILLFAKAK